MPISGRGGWFLVQIEPWRSLILSHIGFLLKLWFFCCERFGMTGRFISFWKEEAAIRPKNLNYAKLFVSNRRFFLPISTTTPCHPELIPLINKQMLAVKRMSEGSPRPTTPSR
jgi:hypothetical protein